MSNDEEEFSPFRLVAAEDVHVFFHRGRGRFFAELPRKITWFLERVLYLFASLFVNLSSALLIVGGSTPLARYLLIAMYVSILFPPALVLYAVGYKDPVGRSAAQMLLFAILLIMIPYVMVYISPPDRDHEHAKSSYENLGTWQWYVYSIFTAWSAHGFLCNTWNDLKELVRKPHEEIVEARRLTRQYHKQQTELAEARRLIQQLRGEQSS